MPSVVALGHLLMDIQLYLSERPEGGEATLVAELRYGGGGSASNFAVAARRLGVKSAIITSVGFDNFGRILLEELLREGVDISKVKIVIGQQTGTSFLLVHPGGEVKVFEYIGASEAIEPRDISDDLFRGFDLLHITMYRLETAIEAARRAKELGLGVSLDPGRVWSKRGLEYLKPLLANVDYLFLNETEFFNLLGGDVERAFGLGVKLVVVKKGARGASAFMKGGGAFEEPAFKVDVVDTTGAGDAFDAAFLTAVLEGKDIRYALRFANAAGALKATRKGARSSPTREEVEKMVATRII
ncbi:MAG: carbohydrate kinase family protein [Thermoproteus sp.]